MTLVLKPDAPYKSLLASFEALGQGETLAQAKLLLPKGKEEEDTDEETEEVVIEIPTLDTHRYRKIYKLYLSDPDMAKHLIEKIQYEPPPAIARILEYFTIYKDGKFVYSETASFIDGWNLARKGYQFLDRLVNETSVNMAKMYILLDILNRFKEEAEEPKWTDADNVNSVIEEDLIPFYKELIEPDDFLKIHVWGAFETFRIVNSDGEFNKLTKDEDIPTFLLRYVFAARLLNASYILRDDELVRNIQKEWFTEKNRKVCLETLYESLQRKEIPQVLCLPGKTWRFSYLPPDFVEPYDFVVPITKYGKVEPEFLDEFERILRDVIRAEFYQASEKASLDDLDEVRDKIYKNRKFEFPYTAQPRLHLSSVNVWNSLKPRILKLLEERLDINYDQKLDMHNKKTIIDLFFLRPMLHMFKNYLMYGIISDEQVIRVDASMHGLSMDQWQILEPFVRRIGFYKQDAFVNTIDARGQERLDYELQLLIQLQYQSLTKIISVLVKSSFPGDWEEIVDYYMGILGNTDEVLLNQFKRHIEQEKKKRQDTSWTYWFETLFESKNEEEEEAPVAHRTILSKYWLDHIEFAMERLRQHIDKDGYSGNAWINITNMNSVQEMLKVISKGSHETVDRALEYSGAKNITKWAPYNVNDPPKVLNKDVLYVARPTNRQPFYTELTRDLLRAWVLLGEIVKNAFAPDDTYNPLEIEEKLSQLQALGLEFDNGVLVKSKSQAISLVANEAIGRGISQQKEDDIVRDNQVVWDGYVSPVIIEPILDRLKAMDRAELERYVTKEQLVSMGAARHGKDGLYLVDGITHSTHPDLTRKFIVGIQNPLTGIYEMRLDVQSELRLLQRWLTLKELLEQAKPDPVLQKELSEPWELK